MSLQCLQPSCSVQNKARAMKSVWKAPATANGTANLAWIRLGEPTLSISIGNCQLANEATELHTPHL